MLRLIIMLEEIFYQDGFITSLMCRFKSFLFKLHRNFKKAEEKVKTAEEDIEENNDKIAELQKQLETLENDATTVLKAYKDAQVGRW